MDWRKVVYPAFGLAGPASAADGGIPYRADAAGTGLQAGLAYAAVVILLALTVAALFMLRKRLAARLAGGLTPAAGLHSIATLRLPQQTMVHVVGYRDQEILFVQSGDKLLRLGQFARSADAAERDA